MVQRTYEIWWEHDPKKCKTSRNCLPAGVYVFWQYFQSSLPCPLRPCSAFVSIFIYLVHAYSRRHFSYRISILAIGEKLSTYPLISQLCAMKVFTLIVFNTFTYTYTYMYVHVHIRIHIRIHALVFNTVTTLSWSMHAHRNTTSYLDQSNLILVENVSFFPVHEVDREGF